MSPHKQRAPARNHSLIEGSDKQAISPVICFQSSPDSRPVSRASVHPQRCKQDQDPEHKATDAQLSFHDDVPSRSRASLRTCGDNGGCSNRNVHIVQSISVAREAILSKKMMFRSEMWTRNNLMSFLFVQNHSCFSGETLELETFFLKSNFVGFDS